jgi:hypothetical protein
MHNFIVSLSFIATISGHNRMDENGGRVFPNWTKKTNYIKLVFEEETGKILEFLVPTGKLD